MRSLCKHVTVSRRTTVYQKVWLPPSITLLSHHINSWGIFVALPSSLFTAHLTLGSVTATTMEYHSVPPEERARDEKGNLLPWGYVYKEYVSFEFALALQSEYSRLIHF